MTAGQQGNCHLCGGHDAQVAVDFATGMRIVSCKRCGHYGISEEAADALGTAEMRSRRYVLSGLARNGPTGQHRLRITAAALPQLLADAPVPTDIFEAADRMLLHLSSKLEGFNGTARVNRDDYPLIFARSPDEYSAILTHLLEAGILRGGTSNTYALTADGWRRLRELRIGATTSDQAFVAMSFAPELRDAWENGFKPALVAGGYAPVRVDGIPHNDKICDRIVLEIRRSGLVVADFTGQRGGVYFEAGLALGLGKSVVWTCKESDVDNLHFDTRQYRHILWSDPDQLRTALHDHILASLPRQRREQSGPRPH